MIEIALEHARRGFAVIPLHGVRVLSDGGFACTCGRADCSSPAKHPIAGLARHGLRDATTNEPAIKSWWRAAPTANVAITTGAKAIVLDIDPRHGGDDSLATLEREHGPLPTTWRVLTGGGGEHIFFSPPPEEVRNSANLIGQGIDVRGAGGYVVAAGSRHVVGRSYEWSVDHHPDETPLAPMPEWLAFKVTTAASADVNQAVQNWRDLVKDGSANGSRNTSVAKLSGHLLRRYVDPVVVLELVLAWNATRCSPPLEEAEVTRTVASICRKESARQAVARG